MRLDELFDPTTADALLEARRPDPQQLIRLIKQAVPEVFELWLYGKRAEGTAKPGTPWTFVAVIPDDVPVARGAEILHELKALRDAIPGVTLEFYLTRDAQRRNEVSPLFWASHGEGKKVWTNRSLQFA